MNTITYTAVKNPEWLNQAHTYLKCEVNFDHESNEYVGFSAIAEGDLPHTHEIYAKCVSGEYGEITEFTVPTDTDDENVALLRSIRDVELTENVDPIVSNSLRWGAMTDAEQQSYSTYRQELLDFPSTSTATRVWNDDVLSMRWVNLTLPTAP